MNNLSNHGRTTVSLNKWADSLFVCRIGFYRHNCSLQCAEYAVTVIGKQSFKICVPKYIYTEHLCTYTHYLLRILFARLDNHRKIYSAQAQHEEQNTWLQLLIHKPLSIFCIKILWKYVVRFSFNDSIGFNERCVV